MIVAAKAASYKLATVAFEEVTKDWTKRIHVDEK